MCDKNGQEFSVKLATMARELMECRDLAMRIVREAKGSGSAEKYIRAMDAAMRFAQGETFVEGTYEVKLEDAGPFMESDNVSLRCSTEAGEAALAPEGGSPSVEMYGSDFHDIPLNLLSGNSAVDMFEELKPEERLGAWTLKLLRLLSSHGHLEPAVLAQCLMDVSIWIVYLDEVAGAPVRLCVKPGTGSLLNLTQDGEEPEIKEMRNLGDGCTELVMPENPEGYPDLVDLTDDTLKYLIPVMVEAITRAAREFSKSMR